MNLDRYHPRILTLIPLDPAGMEKLQESGDVDVRAQLSEQELEKIIGEYNALIVSSDTPVHGRTIEYAYQLQIIGVAGAALDHINVSAARAQGVEIVNVPDRRTLAIAEQTIGLMLTLAHRYNAVGLAGKTLGIVGFGAVGHKVARRGRAFEWQNRYIVLDGATRTTALNALVHDYTHIGKITRTLNTDLNEMVAEVPGLAALVIFPQFTLEDVLQAAVDGQLLPAGITRFVIPGRILRLHAELERLRAQESLARKNAWLDRMLADKLARRNVRFYQEPVILLDE